MRKLIITVLSVFVILNSETLFEVKDASNNKVLDVSTDGLRVMNQGDTLMVIGSEGIKVFIEQDATKALSRKFSVTTTSAKGTKAQNKVFEIATDEGATFYNPSDNSDEILSISKGNIIANVNPTLNRDFIVNDQASAKGGGNLMKISNEGTFEVVNDSTMLWYKQRNAFRVGHILITDPLQVGQASFASGYRSSASGRFSSSMGVSCSASDYASTAIGAGCVADGFVSTALGCGSKALGDYSTAIGAWAESAGYRSVALGYETESIGEYSFTSGNQNIASGQNSTSIGLANSSTGGASFSVGENGTASGYASFTAGSYNTASADFSSAFGSNNQAQSCYSLVLGRYNLVEGSPSVWVSTDPLFVVGNGTSSSARSNAFEVKKNGNVLIPAGKLGVGASPLYKVHVEDVSTSNDNPAVYGKHSITENYGIGVKGESKWRGVEGHTSNSSGFGSGLYGNAEGAGTGERYGIFGTASGGDVAWAGYFSGNVRVTGTITEAKSGITVDHPLDPENKYLSHSNVISDDMTSVYNGNATLNVNGKATILMPEWFEKLNKDYKYQLTAIGAPGPNLYISKEISNNNFEISGGVSGMKVSWQVTASRNDNFAKNNPLKVETDKKENEKGLYMHPESFGLSEEKGIDYQVNKILPETTSK